MSSLLERLKKSSASLSEKTAASMENKVESEFYYPTFNEKRGSAEAKIRFLPSADPDALPYVTVYKHFFKGDDGRWFVMDMCPTTIGEECEVCSKNSKLWKTNSEKIQEEIRKRKRKKTYFCNILVLSDPEHPEHEGKVFPFRFGSSIFNMLTAALNPKFSGEEKFNPFDIWDGADFNLRLFRDKSKGNQMSYESCRFDRPSPLYNGDEEKLNEVVEQLQDLKKYCDPNLIMSKETLAKRLPSAYEKLSLVLDEDDIPSESKSFMRENKIEKESKIPWEDIPMSSTTPTKGSEENDNDVDNFFKDILNDD